MKSWVLAARKLRAEGRTVKSIALSLGVCKDSVYRANKGIESPVVKRRGMALAALLRGKLDPDAARVAGVSLSTVRRLRRRFASFLKRTGPYPRRSKPKPRTNRESE